MGNCFRHRYQRHAVNSISFPANIKFSSLSKDRKLFLECHNRPVNDGGVGVDQRGPVASRIRQSENMSD